MPTRRPRQQPTTTTAAAPSPVPQADSSAAATRPRDERSRAKNMADLHRLLGMIVMFQSGEGWTPERLAAHFGVTQRTIFRDVKKIESSGLEVVFDRGKKSYRLAGQAFLQAVQLTPEEALALIVLCEDLVGREQIGLLKPAYDALFKIESQLPPALRESLGEVMDHIHIQLARAGEPEDASGIDRVVRRAMTERRALSVEYRSAGKAADRFLFEPYGLFFGQRAWYVVGRSHKHAAVRWLKLRRMQSAELTPRGYRIPEGFSIQEHLGNAWIMMKGEREHDVEVRFAPGGFAGNIAETRWHQTQRVEHHADGAVSLHFRVAGLDEIQWWVLGMGPSCRVVAPPELAGRVKDLAVSTAALYASPSAPGVTPDA